MNQMDDAFSFFVHQEGCFDDWKLLFLQHLGDFIRFVDVVDVFEHVNVRFCCWFRECVEAEFFFLQHLEKLLFVGGRGAYGLDFFAAHQFQDWLGCDVDMLKVVREYLV